jgi:parallel beta helix pectate lyase-like protein
MGLQGERKMGPVLLALAVVTLMVALTAPTASAAPPCQTKNVRTGVEYKDASAVATAITAAASGDTINVWGRCVGNFVVDRDLTLRGKGGGATLDGNQTGRVLNITTGTTATIQALTITNGHRDGLGGGIYVRPDATATLVDSAVTGNTGGAKSIGGGIEADEGSSVTLIRSVVSDNSAGSSGGIDMFFSTVSLIDSRVTGNRATRTPGPREPGADGCGFGDPIVLYACAGGIWNYHGTLSLTNTTVSSNTAAYRGGGLRTDATLDAGNPIDGITTLSGSTAITSNTATDQGGGIWAAARVPDPSRPGEFLPTDPNGTVRAADGTASFTDPISGDTLPAWTGSLSGNAPDQCFPTLTLGTHSCGSTFS